MISLQKHLLRSLHVSFARTHATRDERQGKRLSLSSWLVTHPIMPPVNATIHSSQSAYPRQDHRGNTRHSHILFPGVDHHHSPRSLWHGKTLIPSSIPDSLRFRELSKFLFGKQEKGTKADQVTHIGCIRSTRSIEACRQQVDTYLGR